ncbi:hypothetical protein [Streptomyces djakartensis]|uniref:Uncharacterized protein n=1 Tax=Streptomyces djakartensis TaxID=68193 RepID=A0ABQ3ABC6_9ACTN|nr:hypothetical protein [Streptomyces djakartensis]GGY45444.1 hypothetical protein GCM10010384_60130 [Streptomyces djakartensis]
MPDMNRDVNRDTPVAGSPIIPDARGETALGTGHGTRPHTDRAGMRGVASDTRGAEADRGAAYGADAGPADTHGAGPDGLGPGTGKATAETARTSGTPGTSRTPGTPGTSGTRGAHLLPHEESDKLLAQLQHAVAGFVDGPRAAVEEADHVLEEITARFTEAVTQRRHTLRRSLQDVDGGEGTPVSSGDTEQLRLALKDYRELAERLLHV